MYSLSSFRESLIWRKSMDLIIAVNHTVRDFPKKERSQKGLHAQLLQSSVRILLRISESRNPLLDSEHDILLRARYHLSETEFLLDVSHFMGYIDYWERQRLHEYCFDVRKHINKSLYRENVLV